jgi:hypothetical protein
MSARVSYPPGGGGGSGPTTDTGWSITGAYTPRKTFDPSSSTYTQKQLVELVCTLIDLLKTYKLPAA